MTTIANSPVMEDRYIAYLAGKNGSNTIGWGDYYKASAAQKHPQLNEFASSIFGSIDGIFFTGAGLLAYPFFDKTLNSAITGSSLEVGLAFRNNLKPVQDLMVNIQQTFIPSDGLFKALFSDLKSKIDSMNLVELGKGIYNGNLKEYRIVNYAGSVLNTLSANYVLIGTAALVLASWFTYSRMTTYAANEIRAEEDLKNTLKERYLKIAVRLEDCKNSKEVQKCAKAILERRVVINKDIEDLCLPSLATWEDITVITKPVFTAAENVIKYSENS